MIFLQENINYMTYISSMYPRKRNRGWREEIKVKKWESYIGSWSDFEGYLRVQRSHRCNIVKASKLLLLFNGNSNNFRSFFILWMMVGTYLRSHLVYMKGLCKIFTLICTSYMNLSVEIKGVRTLMECFKTKSFSLIV